MTNKNFDAKIHKVKNDETLRPIPQSRLGWRPSNKWLDSKIAEANKVGTDYILFFL